MARYSYRFTSNYSHLNHGAKSDESNQRILRKEVQCLLQRVLKLVKFVISDTSIKHENEDGWASHPRGQFVFQSCVLRNELSWENRLRNRFRVVRREVIARTAVRAGPYLTLEINQATQRTRKIFRGKNERQLFSSSTRMDSGPHRNPCIGRGRTQLQGAYERFVSKACT